jgi:hypothetical protein
MRYKLARIVGFIKSERHWWLQLRVWLATIGSIEAETSFVKVILAKKARNIGTLSIKTTRAV